jgi:hypothetical protein
VGGILPKRADGTRGNLKKLLFFAELAGVQGDSTAGGAVSRR